MKKKIAFPGCTSEHINFLMRLNCSELTASLNARNAKKHWHTRIRYVIIINYQYHYYTVLFLHFVITFKIIFILIFFHIHFFLISATCFNIFLIEREILICFYFLYSYFKRYQHGMIFKWLSGEGFFFDALLLW